jgi:hypothetical protein
MKAVVLSNRSLLEKEAINHEVFFVCVALKNSVGDSQ